MKVSELYSKIREHERTLAPGSETILWGYFRQDLIDLGIIKQYGDIDYEVDVDEDFYSYWLHAYDYLKDNPNVDNASEIDSYADRHIGDPLD